KKNRAKINITIFPTYLPKIVSVYSAISWWGYILDNPYIRYKRGTITRAESITDIQVSRPPTVAVKNPQMVWEINGKNSSAANS
ncbi:MAG TPA: hypothetical protein VFD15_02555, partial [Clostridia bacterium]|nr:hypothetical protein [Clostridia bacterium]